MKVRILSDLHLEFGYLDVPKTDDDKDTILVLAGDIGLAKKDWTFKEFVEDMSMQFKEVIFIMGNHEHYRGSFRTSKQKLLDALADCPNVHVMDKESKVFDDVAFVCATMWTSMDGCDALVMEQARLMMNDYKLVRTGPSDTDAYLRKLHPKDTVEDHIVAVRYIFDEIEKQKADGKKVVVVTHQGPSWQSVAECYKGQPLNGAYVSDLDERIHDAEPDVWIHGHTHHSFDYMIGNTRVICNPRGYDPMELNPTFDKFFNIDI